jgi:type IV pilus assembly protein PilP
MSPLRVASLATVLLLTACAEKAKEPVAARAARSQATPAASSEVLPAPAPAPAYAYNPVEKRDPFRAPLTKVDPPTPCEPSQPLCRYDLDELKLTGVVTGMANPIAVLESPKGKGYWAHAGTRVGRNGVVKQVLRDGIVVAQLTGEEVVLRLRPEPPIELDE